MSSATLLMLIATATTHDYKSLVVTGTSIFCREALYYCIDYKAQRSQDSVCCFFRCCKVFSYIVGFGSVSVKCFRSVYDEESFWAM
ncbi:hypothetical protein M5689_014293 [Euphorbia peplus]|nr:hypothetical protein M5689_014293 [Euphorbia peplus]